ncbi:Zinc-finger homeodomain protein 6, partial [Mucuna pruriens]
SLGLTAFDGCHEFLQGRLDQNGHDNLLCAACDCHRSFHRQFIPYSFMPQTQTKNAVNVREPEEESKPKSMKRTIFTPEQRTQMTAFAEKVVWKPLKHDKDQVERFCSEMGINRKMFLVWLNNNRHQAMQNATAPQPDPRTT